MEKNKWQKIDFKIKWNGTEDDKKLYVDLIVIDLLIRPVIKEIKLNSDLWTFHRSASEPKKPEGGHRLKFNFYIEPQKAETILSNVKLNPHFNFIRDKYLDLSENEIKIIPPVEDNDPKYYEIEAISPSERGCPEEIRKVWPYYIKGACETLISLIEEVKNSKNILVDITNPEQVEKDYKEIDQKIAELWFSHGWHPFFHHFYAIFGYKPLSYYDLIIFRQI